MESDFFESHSSEGLAPAQSEAVRTVKSHQQEEKQPEDSGAPDVSIALSAPAVAPQPVKKSTIGGKKPTAKKAGLGAKKGGRRH